jgi:hypothetical protein
MYTMPPSQHQPAPEEWESHREEIARLYVEERRKLREVMALMDERHSFRAT